MKKKKPSVENLITKDEFEHILKVIVTTSTAPSKEQSEEATQTSEPRRSDD